MKKQSVFSKNFHRKSKAIEGGLSFSVEELHKSAFFINKLENAKATLKKYPIPMELFKK